MNFTKIGKKSFQLPCNSYTTAIIFELGLPSQVCQVSGRFVWQLVQFGWRSRPEGDDAVLKGNAVGDSS